jgi:hypothetical protein
MTPLAILGFAALISVFAAVFRKLSGPVELKVRNFDDPPEKETP